MAFSNILGAVEPNNWVPELTWDSKNECFVTNNPKQRTESVFHAIISLIEPLMEPLFWIE